MIFARHYFKIFAVYFKRICFIGYYGTDFAVCFNICHDTFESQILDADFSADITGHSPFNDFFKCVYRMEAHYKFDVHGNRSEGRPAAEILAHYLLLCLHARFVFFRIITIPNCVRRVIGICSVHMLYRLDPRLNLQATGSLQCFTFTHG